jgi:hypothetical protein
MEPVQGQLAVLSVEDDERLARLTARYLESHEKDEGGLSPLP